MVKKSAPTTTSINPKNEKIVDEFEKLVSQIKYDIDHAPNKKEQIKHGFRLRQIRNAINIIKKYPKEIKEGKELKDIKGIGKNTISRIDEILETGKLSEIKKEEEIKEYVKYADELQEIIGIGPRTAFDLVKNYNIKSIEELKKAYNNGEIELNDEILVGLKYHGVYKQHIPRNEIDLINKYLEKQVKSVDPKLEYIICGSYRRKKDFSNDVDVLITHPDVKTKLQIKFKENYLRLLVKKLKKDKFILDDLTDKDFEVKYMGFCQYKNKKKYPVRRIDIRYVPHESYYTSLLYFTGSGPFNEKMRGLAKELGYMLNEYGLYKVEGQKKKRIKVNSEKEIFEKLGMEYIPPEKR